MSKPREEPPEAWDISEEWDIKHSGDDRYDIWWVVTGEIEQGGSAKNIIVWHWHTPTVEGWSERWIGSHCGNHTVVQVEPLTLTASLACGDGGCTWHGFLENGVWRSV